MTRRTSLQLLSGLMGGFTQKPLVSSGLTLVPDAPMSLTFLLGQWTKIIVSYKGESVTIDPAEMFAALKEPR